MSISCKICNKEFGKIIPWQHLKEHNISTVDYKVIHGEVYSDATLAKLSNRIPHNKGVKVTDPDKLSAIQLAIDKREQKYQQGIFVRLGTSKTEEQKKILSEKSKIYAEANPCKMKERTKKAIDTKIKRGYDFGSPMRGKHHSIDTIQNIKILATARVQQSTIDSHANILLRLTELGFSIINDIAENNLQLVCNNCSSEFSFTKQYFTPSKFKKEMCPTCFPRDLRKSKKENELYEYIASICPDSISGYREHYHSKEIDIYIPSKKLGIEFNGLYWHSEEILLSNNKSPKSDFEKQQYFSTKGIQIVSVFEDEWDYKQDIVKSRLANLLGVTTTSIYARKCQVKSVSSKEASEFCDKNHLMGRGRSNIRLGLYHNNELVSLMTFTNSNLSRKSSMWEINRFASLLNINVIGGASKLFKNFLRNIDPVQLVSYADNRWSTGDLYNILGFKKINNGSPNYWYTKTNTINRIHRFSLRKNNDDNPLLTEVENRKLQGYNRVWDCGSSKWIWVKGT